MNFIMKGSDTDINDTYLKAYLSSLADTNEIKKQKKGIGLKIKIEIENMKQRNNEINKFKFSN